MSNTERVLDPVPCHPKIPFDVSVRDAQMVIQGERPWREGAKVELAQYLA